MGPFELLGIDENADEREIKRAYARRLKTTRPDDDPQGFQQLNDAYQFCLGLAQPESPHAVLRDVVSIPIPSPLPITRPSITPGPVDPHIVAEPDTDRTPNILLPQLYAFASRSNPRQIGEWLDAQPELYSLAYKERIAPSLIGYLSSQPPLSPPALEALLGYFRMTQVGHAYAHLEPELQHLRAAASAAYPGLAQLQFRTSVAPRQSHVDARDNSGQFRILWWILMAAAAIGRLIAASHG